MNESFETIRKELKKYNAEDNSVPPKLVIAGKSEFLDIEHKKSRNSQFIIGVREFHKTEKFLFEKTLDELKMKSGQQTLGFHYNDRPTIETVLEDFKDYYNMPLSNEVFQRIGSAAGPADLEFAREGEFLRRPVEASFT